MILFAILFVLATAASFYLLYSKSSEPALPVVVFEKVGIPPKNTLLKHEWTSPLALKKQILWLKKHGFNFLNFHQLQQDEKLPSKPVLLVFMGGYKNFLTEVFPLLEELKLPATLCLVPNLIGTYNAWQNPAKEPWQNLLTQHDLKTIYKSGHISFAATPLTNENSADFSDEDICFALQEALFRLKTQYGFPPSACTFWPYCHSKASLDIALRQGDLPFISAIRGTNPVTCDNRFFKTLYFSRFPIKTKLTLWKLR